MFKSKRIGKVKLSIQLIDDEPEAVRALFSFFVPLKAEILPEGCIEYTGISERFDEREPGFVTPYYDFLLTRTPEGKIVITDVTKLT